MTSIWKMLNPKHSNRQLIGKPMRTHKYLIPYTGLLFKSMPLWFTVLAVFLWGGHLLFADTAVLERIVEAERTVHYIGASLRTSSSSRGTRTFEEHVIHVPGDASYRKLLSVVGERKLPSDQQNSDERQRNDRRRERDENDRNNRRREQSKWRQVRIPFSQEAIKLIGQNYNLAHQPSDERIANHEADLLIISPKFAGRPTKHIFFARENGVILRVEDYDADGVLREIFVYTRISFNANAVNAKWQAIEKKVRPEQRRSRPSSLAEAEKILKTKPVQPEYLPPGFQLQGVRSIKRKENNTIFLEYTDGLVDFTLFEDIGKPPRGRGEEIPVQLGQTTVYKHRFGSTNAFRWSGEEIHFLLFGAMPTTEMQKIVESIIDKAKVK